jgi:hypothetical protein
MSGGLVQLVAIGAQNQAMNLRNLAHEYYTYESQGLQSLIISRQADIVNLEYLELTFCNPERNNLDDVKKIMLRMTVGGQIIQQFPLSLFVNLNEPIICDGKMYINLCFDMLFGNLKMIALQYHEVRVEFINNFVNCISRYGLVSKLTYLDTDERRNLALNPSDDFIQQVSFINVITDLNDINQTSNVYDIRLPFSNISKGLFIECDNVDNLNNIKLTLNGSDRFNLNRFLIRTKCKKINQNLLYFPFNYDKEYSNRTISSYEGAPNFSRIDTVKLKLDLDTPINNVKIYSLNANIFRQLSGLGECAFTPEFCSETYELRNNTVTIPERVLPSLSQLTVGTTIIYTGPTPKYITEVDASNCPILFETINAGEKYMSCHQCKNNFSEVAIKQWLECRRPHQRTCPLCRVHWSNFEIYINELQSENI